MEGDPAGYLWARTLCISTPSQTLLDSMQTKEAVGIWKFESQKRNVGSSRFLLERVFLLEENV